MNITDEDMNKIMHEMITSGKAPLEIAHIGLNELDMDKNGELLKFVIAADGSNIPHRVNCVFITTMIIYSFLHAADKHEVKELLDDTRNTSIPSIEAGWCNTLIGIGKDIETTKKNAELTAEYFVKNSCLTAVSIMIGNGLSNIPLPKLMKYKVIVGLTYHLIRTCWIQKRGG